MTDSRHDAFVKRYIAAPLDHNGPYDDTDYLFWLAAEQICQSERPRWVNSVSAQIKKPSERMVQILELSDGPITICRTPLDNSRKARTLTVTLHFDPPKRLVPTEAPRRFAHLLELMFDAHIHKTWSDFELEFEGDETEAAR